MTEDAKASHVELTKPRNFQKFSEIYEKFINLNYLKGNTLNNLIKCYPEKFIQNVL
jgi:hypothetical protein